MNASKLLLSSLFIFIAHQAFSQITLNSLKNKAGDAVENAIERKIEKELDKAAEKVVDKYWDRVIGKYYADLYDQESSPEFYPIMLSQDVELLDKYEFDQFTKLRIDNYNKKGKLDETAFIYTYSNQDHKYLGTTIEDKSSKKSSSQMFIINDFENKTMIMLMDSEGEKARVAYSIQFNEAAVQSNMNEINEGDFVYSKIGEKEILGYLCQGYRYDNEGNFSEIWATEEEVYGMESMFNMKYTKSDDAMEKMPEGYPEGSIMEVTALDYKTNEKTSIRVEEINKEVKLEFVMEDYPPSGTDQADQEPDPQD